MPGEYILPWRACWSMAGRVSSSASAYGWALNEITINGYYTRQRAIMVSAETIGGRAGYLPALVGEIEGMPFKERGPCVRPHLAMKDSPLPRRARRRKELIIRKAT